MLRSLAFAAFLFLLSAPAVALAEFKLQVRNAVTDMLGNPITSIAIGEQYKLLTFATDVRNPPPAQENWRGVFAAAADISYDPALSSIDTAQLVEFGSFFYLIHDSVLNPGRVQATASTGSLYGLGNEPQFLFSVVLTAENPGLQVFTPTKWDWEYADYALYVEEIPLPSEFIEFVGTSLQIIPEPSTYLLGALALVGLCAFRRKIGTRATR